MTSQYDYDLIVIGSGPAGEKGAAQAAYFGKKVALIERAPHLGGAGINTGTVPSKTLRETALYFSGLRQRGLYGIDYSLKDNLTVGDFMYRKQIVVESEWGIIQRNLDRHHIEVIYGEASLRDAHTVRVRQPDGTESALTTNFILVATGSSPFHPPEVPFDHRLIYDSDSILNMSHIPKTMTVVGGGVIGIEYATIFTALGVQVTLVESRNRLLSFVDGEIVERMQRHLERLGLRFILNTRVNQLHVHEDHVDMTLQTGERLDCEIALYAAGRQSNVEGLGLEAVGVTLGNRGLILVNEKYQTSVPNIYAAGDVIGFPALASTSMEQARVAMVHAFGLRYKEQVSPIIPLAIYTIPEISTVGLSEDDCKAKSLPYLVGRAYYETSARGQIIGDLSGMLKLVFARDDKKLLGAHHIGEMASELVHIGAHVMAAGGTIDAFINAVYNYPTLADSYKYAAYDGLGNWERWLEARNSKLQTPNSKTGN
ncbi:MAG: pyruvate/2-oxoglutarate dehydrogenase complex, dihydrolipoamide dehydrogenase component [Anaerolineales bacterium]|nr:pyruvate/2-oxoglutarate dehydrogenase complex, dihydrolipoamide dehydrogenase component [Anaerolineales bacterium]